MLRLCWRRKRDPRGATAPEGQPLPVHAGDAAPRPQAEAWERAVDLYRSGAYEAAAAAFARLAGVEQLRAHALAAEGSAFMCLGRFHAAVDRFEEAVRFSPADSAAALNLATALYRVGRHAEALEQSAAAVELLRLRGYSVAPARHLQGLIHLAVGRLDRARVHLADALEADPAYAPAALGLAQCAVAAGDRRSARTHLRAARRLARRARGPLRDLLSQAADRLDAGLAHGAPGGRRAGA